MASEDVGVDANGRAVWVDNLKVVLITGVIVVHTATAYLTDFADWYYDDELRPSQLGFAVFAVPALLGAVFGLGPLFWLAGWFSAMTVRRRGPRRFAKARLARLGVPLVLFVALVNPTADLVGDLRRGRRSFWAYLGETEFSVMWFLAALLVCSLPTPAGGPVAREATDQQLRRRGRRSRPRCSSASCRL